MKIGDLICYNAAGMRSKTIGMYMGMQIISAPYYRPMPYIAVYKIFWLVSGEILPRALECKPDHPPTPTAVKTKGLHYHEDHGCFEIIKKSS